MVNMRYLTHLRYSHVGRGQAFFTGVDKIKYSREHESNYVLARLIFIHPNETLVFFNPFFLAVEIAVIGKEMFAETTIFANNLSHIKQIWVIVTHIKLCLATAIHNFK